MPQQCPLEIMIGALGGPVPLDDSQTPNGHDMIALTTTAVSAVGGAKWAITGKQNWRSGLNRDRGYGA